MTKIRTPEDVLKDWITSPEGGWEPSDHEAVIEAMKEYAKQFIDLAAEELSNTHNSDTILKLKERVV